MKLQHHTESNTWSVYEITNEQMEGLISAAMLFCSNGNLNKALLIKAVITIAPTAQYKAMVDSVSKDFPEKACIELSLLHRAHFLQSVKANEE